MQNILFFITACTVAGLILNWKVETWLHQRRLQSKKHRIHVNGIRGKSTVTRIIAGILREAEIETVGKTTGSAACIIDRHGTDHSIRRNGSPTILEQVDLIRNLDRSVDALVIECMAIKPEYQRICETKIVRSNIGIITNVREDHQDVLGESLEEITWNLLSTCPKNGILITSEQNPTLLPIFKKVAESNNTRLIVVDPDSVSNAEVEAFSYVAFKENIAIGFAIADQLEIDRDTALAGMTKAAPDPGVLRIEHKWHQNRNITWADLFAVNDRESVIACVDKVTKLALNGALRIGLLNNREDREHRALQFARIAANDLQLDYVALLGAYENRVAQELIRNGFSPHRIIRFTLHANAPGETMVNQLLEHAESADVLMIGLVNIHTRQAESLRHWFDGGLSDVTD